MKFYAGIGSRETPPSTLAHMTAIAHTLRGAGVWLRSGGAAGADEAFERGAYTWAHIYLPWPGFTLPDRDAPPGEERVRYAAIVHDTPTPDAFAMAAEYHPAWESCKSGARALLARNCHVILGDDLKTPAWRVICWTPEGSLDGAGLRGNTNHALRIAAAHHITVTNLRRPKHLLTAMRTEWSKLDLSLILGDSGETTAP